MNRAARVAQSAGSGQVWATETAWFAAQEPLEKTGSGVHANHLGVFSLKVRRQSCDAFAFPAHGSGGAMASSTRCVSVAPSHHSQGVMDPVPLVHCTEPVMTAVHKPGAGAALRRTDTDNGSVLSGTVQSSFAGEDGATPSRSRFRGTSSATLNNHPADALLHSGTGALSHRTGTVESTAPHMLISHTEDWAAGNSHPTHDTAAAGDPGISGASARLAALADSNPGDRRSSVAALGTVVHMASPGGLAAAGALVFSPRRSSRVSYPARASPSGAAAAPPDGPFAAAAAAQQLPKPPHEAAGQPHGKVGGPAKPDGGPVSEVDGEIHAWLPPPPQHAAGQAMSQSGAAWEHLAHPAGTALNAAALQLYASPSGTMFSAAGGSGGGGVSSQHNLLAALQQRAASIATTAPSSRAGGQPLALHDAMVAALTPPSQAALPSSLRAEALAAEAPLAPVVPPGPPAAPATPAPASLLRTKAEGAASAALQAAQPAAQAPADKRHSDSHRTPPPAKAGRESQPHAAPAARPAPPPHTHRGAAAAGHGRGPATQPMPGGAGGSSGVVWGLHSQCDGVGELLGFAGLANMQVASLLPGEPNPGASNGARSRPHNGPGLRATGTAPPNSTLPPIHQSIAEEPLDGGARATPPGEGHGKAGRWGEVLRKTLQLHRRRPGAGSSSAEGPGSAVTAAAAAAALGSQHRVPTLVGTASGGGARATWGEAEEAQQGVPEAMATFNGLRVP